MSKQTAVDWIIQWGRENPVALQSDYYSAIEQAKQMEKEQIINAFENGIVAYDNPDRISDDINFDAENYYNQIYNQ